MSSIDEIRDIRIKKLELLKEKGINPYPAESKRELYLKDVIDNFENLEKNGEIKWVSGRIMSLRGQGAIIFTTIFDGTASFQGLLKKDILGEEKLSLWGETVDIGDFVELQGKFFTTQRGEKSVEAVDWRMLSKTLRPLPEKWHGLVDVEERFRKRYLDFVMNPELRDLMVKKSKFWDATREFMKNKGFLEVETPTLETTTGGAEATPFKTHHNDYDLDVYLRISIGELWQKRLMAGGFPKTFEIGRAYRNEGTSPEHAQEFTNMEFYWAFANYNDGMALVREMYIDIAKKVFGKTEFTAKGYTFDLDTEWPKIDYRDEILKQTNIDIYSADEKEMEKKLQELKVTYDGNNKERLMDTLWKYCRKNIAGPAFLVNHPTLVAPLAKSNADGRTVQRFQPIFAGSEVGNGYSELNDPIDQKERFELQQKLIDKGDTEAMMADFEFVEMLEHGMPPTCGFGFGERMFAILADKPLRELQTFPLMKPEIEGKKADKKGNMVVAVLNKGANMEAWQELNTVAHLNAAFGARVGRADLFTRDTINSKDGQQIKLNIKNAIMIKAGDTNDDLKNLLKEARENKLEVDEFIREMIETTSDKKLVENTGKKNFDEIEYLGVLVYGPKDVVEKVTEKFKLY